MRLVLLSSYGKHQRLLGKLHGRKINHSRLLWNTKIHNLVYKNLFWYSIKSSPRLIFSKFLLNNILQSVPMTFKRSLPLKSPSKILYPF